MTSRLKSHCVFFVVDCDFACNAMTSRSMQESPELFFSQFFRRFICMGVLEQPCDGIDTTFLVCLVRNAISFKYKRNRNHYLLLLAGYGSLDGATRQFQISSLKTNYANPRISKYNRFDAMQSKSGHRNQNQIARRCDNSI